MLLSVAEPDASTLGAAELPVFGPRGEIASAARGMTTSAMRRMRSGNCRDTVEGVRDRIDGLLGDRRLQRAGDGLLAFLLAGTSVGAVLAGDHTSWGHPTSLAIGLALA